MAASRFRLVLAAALFIAVSVPISVPASEFASPKGLRWPKGAVKLATSSSLFSNQNSIKPGTNVTRSLVRAISEWEAVAAVEIEIVSSDQISANTADGAGDGISLLTAEPTTENLSLFTKQNANSTAVTRTFFNARNEITEADIVLNPMYQFSDDGTPGTYDLDTVLAHEIGHLLGLKHSIVPTALMYDEVQKNGLNFSSGRSLRLAGDDLAKIRSIYGPSVETSDCCDTASGTIASFSGKGTVFAIDARSGSVVASTAVSKTGSFEFGGILEGNYELWLSHAKASNGEMGDAMLGRLTVSAGESKVLQLKSRAENLDFSVDKFGSIGRLSKRAIPVERGRVNQILLSGNGLASGHLKFGTTSKQVKVLSVKDVSSTFGKGETVVQIELEVPDNFASGDLGIFVENEKGVRKHLFGVLSVS